MLLRPSLSMLLDCDATQGYGKAAAISAAATFFLSLMIIAGMTLEKKEKMLYGNNADVVLRRSKVVNRLQQCETIAACGSCLVLGCGIASLVKLIQFTIDINDIEEICVLNGDDYQRLNTLKWVFWTPAMIACFCGCCDRIFCDNTEKKFRYVNRKVDREMLDGP